VIYLTGGNLLPFRRGLLSDRILIDAPRCGLSCCAGAAPAEQYYGRPQCSKRHGHVEQHQKQQKREQREQEREGCEPPLLVGAATGSPGFGE
jgi:hypothetical protein